MNTRTVISILGLFAAALAAPVSWAGHDGYAYQQSHQKLLASSYRLSDQAKDFQHYAKRYSYSGKVRTASKRLYQASDELYYLIKRNADEYQLRQAYQYASKAYYDLRGYLAYRGGDANVLNQVGYALHDVEADYQRYQRQLARNTAPYQRKGQNLHSRGHGNRTGVSYRSGPYGSKLSVQLRLR
ncbi:MAG: hypothetical protein PF630_11530 [Gammaproteobacteria bacterium]|jgi:hypothetical protein|nr:hypothetical protein [Gammaproteobacteria bacterium]